MDGIINLFIDSEQKKNTKLQLVVIIIYRLVMNTVIGFWIADKIGYVYSGEKVTIESVILFFSSGTVIFPIFIFFGTLFLTSRFIDFATSIFGWMLNKIFHKAKLFLILDLVMYRVLNKGNFNIRMGHSLDEFIFDNKKNLKSFSRVMNLFYLHYFTYLVFFYNRYLNFYLDLMILIIFTLYIYLIFKLHSIFKAVISNPKFYYTYIIDHYGTDNTNLRIKR